MSDNKQRIWKYLFAHTHPQADGSKGILDASNNLTGTLNSHGALNDAFNAMPDVNINETLNEFINGTTKDTKLTALQGLQKLQEDQGYYYHNPELPVFSESGDSLDLGFPNNDLDFRSGIDDISSELFQNYNANPGMSTLDNVGVDIAIKNIFNLLMKRI